MIILTIVEDDLPGIVLCIYTTGNMEKQISKSVIIKCLVIMNSTYNSKCGSHIFGRWSEVHPLDRLSAKTHELCLPKCRDYLRLFWAFGSPAEDFLFNPALVFVAEVVPELGAEDFLRAVFRCVLFALRIALSLMRLASAAVWQLNWVTFSALISLSSFSLLALSWAL